MAEILRLGFAGLGQAAKNVLPEVAELPYISLTAVADLREDARRRFREEYEGEAYETVEELCQSPNVDAIYVATPHELHAQHAITALEHRKHVIVEKPMALSLEDAERMNAAAEKHGVKLMAGHTHSFDPPIRKMREVIRSGELGRVRMINTWYYTNFMFRAYPSHELWMSRGVVLNQGPHQVDIVRLLGGGLVRSVRAMTFTEPERPPEGAYVCYLEFENGAAASLVYSGMGFFHTGELHWNIGEGGLVRDPEANLNSRRSFQGLDPGERDRVIEELKEQSRYGGRPAAHPGAFPGWEGNTFMAGEIQQPFFGLTLVSCEKGEMRQSPGGVYVYGNEKREVSVAQEMRGRQAEVTELYEGVVNGKPMFHDGRWGEATLEVCLAILQSADDRKEIAVSHQVPVVD